MTAGVSSRLFSSDSPGEHGSAETVAAGATWPGDITAAFTASGWHDFTVTVSADSSWSQRFTGHLENGLTSVTR